MDQKKETADKVQLQFFAKLANAFSCLETILDNAFLHLRDCTTCVLILLSSSIASLLKSFKRKELRAILRNSPTRAE